MTTNQNTTSPARLLAARVERIVELLAVPGLRNTSPWQEATA